MQMQMQMQMQTLILHIGKIPTIVSSFSSSFFQITQCYILKIQRLLPGPSPGPNPSLALTLALALTLTLTLVLS